MTVVSFTILGEPASKSNQRRMVKIDGKRRSIKSKKALAWANAAYAQIPGEARVRLTEPVSVILSIWYRTERPDMDAALILDVLQDRYITTEALGRVLIQSGVYRNDRQVRELHVYHGIDRKNPRVEITVYPRESRPSDSL